MSMQLKDPFPTRGVGGYFFTTPALRLRLDLIKEYIRRGETPVLILGEAGAGKSTFLNQLVMRADHNWRVVKIPAVSTFSATEVGTFLNAELRLPSRVSAGEMLRELDRWLDRISVRDQVAVVVVDSAHELSDETLSHLATLHEQLQSKNCRVLMTGEPCLRSRLKALKANARSYLSGHVINIPSLDQREVASYIDMKLYHAGMEGKGPFNRTIIDDIARSSHGHPGRIDAMASDLLNEDRKGLHWRVTSDQLQRLIRRLSAFRDTRHP